MMQEQMQDTENQEPKNLEQLLGHIAEASRDQDQVSLERIVNAVGRRSFGPLLLMVGVIAVSPLSGIPGLPSTLGVLVFLIAIQLLFGRHQFWLPTWILNRSVPRHRLITVLDWLARPARFIDRAIKPRLTFMVHDSGKYLIAIVCVVISVTMPALEVVPFLATAAGVALTIFGLSLVAYDGALALFGFMLTAVAVGAVLYTTL